MITIVCRLRRLESRSVFNHWDQVVYDNYCSTINVKLALSSRSLTEVRFATYYPWNHVWMVLKTYWHTVTRHSAEITAYNAYCDVIKIMV